MDDFRTWCSVQNFDRALAMTLVDKGGAQYFITK